jgi:uncharacterized OsmC-like protein
MNPQPPDPQSPESEFSFEIEQLDDFQFRVVFDKPEHPVLHTDEPAPLGQDSGPNPSRLLAAAVGNCLSASLLFCARKARLPVGPIRTRVTTRLARNSDRRLRIHSISVSIDPGVDPQELSRCLARFEDFCVVTQSVREGIDVQVEVIHPGRPGASPAP